MFKSGILKKYYNLNIQEVIVGISITKLISKIIIKLNNCCKPIKNLFIENQLRLCILQKRYRNLLSTYLNLL